MKLTEEQLQRVLKDRTYWATIAARIIHEAKDRTYWATVAARFIREAQAHAGSTGSWPSSQNQTVTEPPPGRIVVDSASAQASSLPDGSLAQLADQGHSTIPSQWQAEQWKRQWQEGMKPQEEPPARIIVKRGADQNEEVFRENSRLQVLRMRRRLGAVAEAIYAPKDLDDVLENLGIRERKKLLLSRRR